MPNGTAAWWRSSAIVALLLSLSIAFACGSDEESSRSGTAGPSSGPGAGRGGQGGEGGAGATGGSGGVAGMGGGQAGSAGSSGSAGSGGGECTPEEKLCDGGCVAIADPAYGCADQVCDPCAVPNASAVCVAGACELGGCDPGFENCNADPGDGCEIDTTSDPDNCSACGNACAFPNAEALCTASVCAIGPCEAGHDDCDGDATNGCEAILDFDPDNCGGCNTPCPPGEQCENAACGVFCPLGKANCDGDAANGCETDLGTVDDCDFCGDACVLSAATAACNAGACAIVACDPGYTDCDGTPANGCETNTDGSAIDCGSCNVVCPSGPNATPICTGGACGLACDGGWDDCNGVPNDGCEKSVLGDVQNCGACGVVCTAPNGTPSCLAGQCAVAACLAGFANCDGVASNGCEVNVKTSLTDCGACGQACPAAAHGTAICANGTCDATCDAGYDDCNGDVVDGCEVQIASDVANCGACGAICATPNAAAECVAGAGGIATCNAGHDDCDGVAGNGCEVDVQTNLDHCGACFAACSVANGTGACQGGTCTVASCNAGAGDCDGVVANGCETGTVTNINNCGTCGNVCTVAHGSPACAGGACQITQCDGGWANCNGTIADGCEVDTQGSVAHCGACNAPCSVANGSPVCLVG